MSKTPSAADPKTFSQETIDAFAELAEMTRPKCGACRVPHICCSPDQCDLTRDMAAEIYGAQLEDAPGAGKLRFLGPEGCVVPPHMRPSCTVHVCGQHLSDQAWAEKYQALRDRAGDLHARDFPL